MKYGWEYNAPDSRIREITEQLKTSKEMLSKKRAETAKSVAIREQ